MVSAGLRSGLGSTRVRHEFMRANACTRHVTFGLSVRTTLVPGGSLADMEKVHRCEG